MNDNGEKAVQRTHRFGLKAQLLLLLFVLNLVAAIAYSAVLYYVDRDQIISGIDGRLRTAAHAVREIVPDGYHQRINDENSISVSEFNQLQDRMSRFAERSDLDYVYSYMLFGDEIHTVSTSATPAEIKAGTQTGFFDYYETAPQPLYQSFADGRIRFDEYSDSFGRFRSIYLPVKVQDGRTYVIGADVSLAILDDRLFAALVESVRVGLAMFVLSMVIGWLLVSRIVGPLLKLTSFTRNMEQNSFQPDVEEMEEIKAISGSRRDEVGSLADAMATMIGRLQRYLVEMEAATAARERVEGELTAARDIQIGMLPRKFPPFPERKDIDVYALLESAKEVGGDLYDYTLIDENRLFFVVGDVSGKGVPAALFMAMTTTLFKATALNAKSTGEIMERVNAELSRDNAAEMFVTAFCGILDLRTGEVEYSDGGHEAPFIVHADGSVERMAKQPGMALGVFDDVPYLTDRFTMQPGDALVMFTDGVSEAENADQALFTTDRID
ncbi:MAG: PP2C family protein-serine/threonine phosphatase, partial [Parasphingorhabdus sp.]